MQQSEGLILGIVIIAVSSFHLIYGVRTGKVIMGSTWRVRRDESSAAFWLMMVVSALCLAAGLYLAIFGFPARADM